jgi:hypothetical protein
MDEPVREMPCRSTRCKADARLKGIVRFRVVNGKSVAA